MEATPRLPKPQARRPAVLATLWRSPGGRPLVPPSHARRLDRLLQRLQRVLDEARLRRALRLANLHRRVKGKQPARRKTSTRRPAKF